MDGLWVWLGHMVHIISTEKGVFLVGNDAWLFEVNGKENLNMKYHGFTFFFRSQPRTFLR